MQTAEGDRIEQTISENRGRAEPKLTKRLHPPTKTNWQLFRAHVARNFGPYCVSLVGVVMLYESWPIGMMIIGSVFVYACYKKGLASAGAKSGAVRVKSMPRRQVTPEEFEEMFAPDRTENWPPLDKQWAQMNLMLVRHRKEKDESLDALTAFEEDAAVTMRAMVRQLAKGPSLSLSGTKGSQSLQGKGGSDAAILAEQRLLAQIEQVGQQVVEAEAAYDELYSKKLDRPKGTIKEIEAYMKELDKAHLKLMQGMEVWLRLRRQNLVDIDAEIEVHQVVQQQYVRRMSCSNG